jgi:hypothetical protein
MPTVPQYQRQSQTQAAPVMTTNLRVPENPRSGHSASSRHRRKHDGGGEA